MYYVYMYNVVTVTILQNVTLHESELAEKCDFRLYDTEREEPEVAHGCL